jgi:hypothetical protein
MLAGCPLNGDMQDMPAMGNGTVVRYHDAAAHLNGHLKLLVIILAAPRAELLGSQGDATWAVAPPGRGRIRSYSVAGR